MPDALNYKDILIMVVIERILVEAQTASKFIHMVL